SAFALITACASTGDVDVPPAEVDLPPLAADLPVIPSAYELAMQSVDELVEAGNEQAAIMRLQQLVGMQDANDEEKAEALFKMAELRGFGGNDVYGAIDALTELIDTYPASALVSDAEEMRDTLRGKATSLNFAANNANLSPTERFNAMFELGDHTDAADMMLARDLKPDNAILLDMYQIGYLCEDETLTGPSYALTDADGTARTLHFCEFGK
ncbi:MAG: tetratricopeptide repeat protein, partial [Pseudomonadota bacterium]